MKCTQLQSTKACFVTRRVLKESFRAYRPSTCHMLCHAACQELRERCALHERVLLQLSSRWPLHWILHMKIALSCQQMLDLLVLEASVIV